MVADEAGVAEGGAGVGVEAELGEDLVVVLTEGRRRARHPAVDGVEPERERGELDGAGHRVLLDLEEPAVAKLRVVHDFAGADHLTDGHAARPQRVDHFLHPARPAPRGELAVDPVVRGAPPVGRRE